MTLGAIGFYVIVLVLALTIIAVVIDAWRRR